MASTSDSADQTPRDEETRDSEALRSVEPQQTSKTSVETGVGKATSQPANSFLTIGIGASAGGLEAFQTFFRHMDEDSGMAFVLISHLAPDHDSLLSELLAKETQMRVLQVTQEVRLQPNQVYVIPPNATLTVDDGILRLSTPVQARGHRAPINIFFRSLAEDQGENAVCVILSGTGSDGTIGMKSIKEFGGLAIAQDSNTAKYDSMPRNAVVTGLVDYVLPVEDIPAKLIEYARHREGLQANLGEDGMLPEAADYLQQICSLLRQRLGHDFSSYKQGTLIRRIQRRIQITQTDSVEAYVAYLKSDTEEVSLLFKDLLIGVTHFFRDPEAFDALSETAIASLVENSLSTQSIRIWIAGCSSGEEAYSIAMLLSEEVERQNARSQVKIFATDIDERALEKARHGCYPESIAEQISPERLERFFIRQDGMFQVAKHLREMCIFSQHSLISDPPFSRLDLISCRNLLIYFDSDLQKRLIPLFHYALGENGYLFLGSSENLSAYSELFRTADKPHRLFQRKEAMVPPQIDFPLVDRSAYRQLSPPRKQTVVGRQSQITREIERILLQDYAPACVIINDQNEVVYFFGRTSKYLEHSQGVPSNNLFDLARRGLRLDLRTVIQSAKRSQREAIRERVSIENDQQIVTVNLIACPVKEAAEDSGLLMIIFQDIGQLTSYEQARAEGNQPEEEAPIIKQLEDELRVTKEHLRSTIEEIETSNEELKSANEELLSMNEELQSSNEELQTSKEEMQSINEELETVNSELRNKVEDLDAANSDIQNLFESTRIATVFLDENLQIKRFTPTATELFNLIGTDIGRPITDISLALEDLDIAAAVQDVLRSLIPIEREVEDKEKSIYYKMRIMPYRTLDNVISGAVLTFVDVTSLRQARNRAEKWAKRQSAIAEIGTYALKGDNNAAAACDHAVEIVCATLDSDVCSLFVCQPDEQSTLLLQSGREWPDEQIGQLTISATDSHPGYTLSVKQPVIVEDFSQERRFKPSPELGARDFVSGISALVASPNQVYGVLTSHATTAYKYNAEDISFLQSIANALSETLQREKTSQALEKSQERLNLAIDTGSMGIWEMEIATGQSTWNSVEYCLLGVNPIEVPEPDLDIFCRYIHPDDVDLVRHKILDAIEQKTEFDTEFRIRKSDRPIRWLSLKARVICDSDGNAAKMIGINYDITKRKQNEEALKAADRRKDDFLAALGHELRNPLNALSSSIALMQSLGDSETVNQAAVAEAATEAAAEADSALEQLSTGQLQQLQDMASRQLNQLNRLVDDLLDVSRVAYQKIQIHPQPMNLIKLLQDMIADAQCDAANKNIALLASLPDTEIWISGDAARLMQAFSNVLQNAVKFSDAGGRVDIEATATEAFVTTKITDTGIGMEPEALSRIFIAFSQEDRSLSRSGGLGLGLPLAKGIVSLHQGKIWADSPGPGQGATITIKLPRLLQEAALPVTANSLIAQPSPSTQPNSPTRKSGRILVIEDQEDSATILEMLLEDMDYQVEIATSGETGLSLAKQFRPDIIISDIGLSTEMNGYAVARAIRSDPQLKDVYLIATSGYGQPEDKEFARASGFDEHFTKPIDLEQLSVLIIQHLASA
ncbi:MAG: CheR family methyltransferase [Phormidesmis sp.]